MVDLHVLTLKKAKSKTLDFFQERVWSSRVCYQSACISLARLQESFRILTENQTRGMLLEIAFVMRNVSKL